MKHFGDITKLSGYDLPVVDVITGGSPCQDLSVAGKRAGLAGERSGLFMEQIRIVKEMRERDRRDGRAAEYVRPRYMVWENVPGAFSSNGGKDFQAVLEEIVKIADETAPTVPLLDKGKWSKSGCLYDDMGRWSIAWRLHDAQYWGVPQRRKRIALVADFGGLSAPEILFERKGMHWYPEPSGTEREGAAGDSEGGFGETGKGYWQHGIQTLRAEGENRPSRPSNVVVSADCDSTRTAGDSERSVGGTGEESVAYSMSHDIRSAGFKPNRTDPLSATDYKEPPIVSVGSCHYNTDDDDIAGTLDANYYKGCGERQGVERTVICGKGSISNPQN